MMCSLNIKEEQLELYSIFKEHYKGVSNDPQTLIMQRADGQKLKGPLFISWEITSACNLSCRHCRAAYNNSKTMHKQISLDKYREVIKQFGSMEIFALGITGGEPFLHPYFWEIIEECKQYNFDIIIYTNGTCINEEVAIRLSTLLDVDDIVHVSLDGGTKAANDRQRGEGSFIKTYRALEILKSVNISVRLNVVPTNLNIDSFPELCDLALKFEVKEFGASPLMLTGRASDKALMPDQNKLFYMERLVSQKLHNSKTKYIGGISGTVHSYLDLSEWICDEINKLSREGRNKKICDAGNRKIFIDAVGDVYPCSLFAEHKEFSVGNIFSDEIVKAWNSKKLEQFRKGFEIISDECKKCKLAKLCNGGCMALAFHAFGEMGAIDPRCSKANKQKGTSD